MTRLLSDNRKTTVKQKQDSQPWKNIKVPALQIFKNVIKYNDTQVSNEKCGPGI